jgi:hypothetical protein
MKKLKIEYSRMKQLFSFHFVLFIMQFALCALATSALAVPETTAVRIADVTTSSFSIVWMTDVAANPSVEVYADSSLQQRVTDGVTIAAMPAGSSRVAQAAQSKGIMKVSVSGVKPATTYYVRTVTKDPVNADNVSFSAPQNVTTASDVPLYRTVNGAAQGLANDLVAFPVYVRPLDQAAEPRLGDLIILEEQGSPYPVSAFAGDGALSPEGVLDLNNLFGPDGSSLAVSGGEIINLRIYRAGSLSTLTHYRKAPQNSAAVSVVGLLKGFFADINLDGRVDDQDFSAFKAQYRTMPNDTTYNPDYNFVDDPDGKVDVREFGKFSKEYGRTDVN